LFIRGSEALPKMLRKRLVASLVILLSVA
jgi:hypothetical protein